MWNAIKPHNDDAVYAVFHLASLACKLTLLPFLMEIDITYQDFFFTGNMFPKASRCLAFIL